MKRPAWFGALAWCAAVGLFAPLWPAGCSKSDAGGDPNALICYVGGTMRPAMERIAADYEKQTGRKVQVDYADSGELMIRIETTKRGDLYVAHDPFQQMLARKGLSHKGWTVATVSPVIAVRKGNPKNIKSVRDLAREDVKVGLTDPDYSTMGHIVPRIFAKAELKTQDMKPGAPVPGKNTVRVYTRTRGGGQIANKVALKELDAAIVWDAIVFLRANELEAVPIDPPYRLLPAVDAITSATGRKYELGRIKVTIDVLTCSKKVEAATQFATFVRQHRDVFAENGFSPAPPEDETAATAASGGAAGATGGTVLLYAGAGLRHAMADIADAFTARTGIKVQTDYAGSGVLITRLKLARQGDLFMPGEVWYLEQVEKEGLVASKKTVACFVPVIIVPKGNPKNIRSLADLVGPGVRVAIGNPKACQVGRATEELIAKNAIDAAALQKNVVFSSVTVTELGVQVQTKAADAAIVWDAVAANIAGDVDVVQIPIAANVISDVAVGVLKVSKNPAAAEKFVQFLTTDEAKTLFHNRGYRTERPK
jgi:molybdate transport system substrate-binding protein